MITFTQNHFTEDQLRLYLTKVPETMAAIRASSMAGWLDLPKNHQEDPTELSHIKAMAEKVKRDSKYLVCIGIGGSYLGARAIYEALEPTTGVKLLFAGHHTSPKILKKIIDTVKEQDFSVNVISKSGTTLEPSLAFAPLRQLLEEKYGKDLAADRIYATTDAEKGTLKEEANRNHYETFVIPDNVGGRFSVLTAVGLFPLAAAGVDIDDLIAGARAEANKIPELSPAANYAAFRSYLRDHAPVADPAPTNDSAPVNSPTPSTETAPLFDTEVLAAMNPELQLFQEWWKQLFGESEGKGDRNIFPASVIYSTDLHSLGQYLQDGRKNLFETFLSINAQDATTATIEQAAKQAHAEARPVAEVLLPDIDARSLGAAIYFFELACALSASFQGVNPFDQPGVERYKSLMRQSQL